jgi:hypothetical protein
VAKARRKGTTRKTDVGGRIIKMDLREIAWIDMDWIHLAQDRDQWSVPVNAVINFRVPCNVWKFLSG